MIDFPAEFRAGTTLSVRNLLTAYPADAGWVLKVAIRGPGAINLESTADGATHVLSASAAVTGAWAGGTYAWAARLEDGTEVVDAGSSSIIILPDLTSLAAPQVATSHAERTLAAIEATIEGRASSDQQSYKIGNRELVRIPFAELVKLRSHYRNEVARERRARLGFGGLMSQHVRVRF